MDTIPVDQLADDCLKQIAYMLAEYEKLNDDTQLDAKDVKKDIRLLVQVAMSLHTFWETEKQKLGGEA